MQSSRTGVLLLPVLALAACSVAETAPPPVATEPVPAPPAVESLPEVPAAPPASPEPSFQERWRAPFSVASRGRPAAREERVVVVRAEAAPAPAAAVETPAAPAGPPAAAAAPPAAPTRPAAERSTRATEAAGSRTHKVEWGETWYGIARRYGVSPAALAAGNPEINPDRLRSGQVLRIPSATTAAPDQRTHRVGPGDSLWGIARRYGVSMEEIRRANRLSDDRVRLGQSLVIPRAQENR